MAPQLHKVDSSLDQANPANDNYSSDYLLLDLPHYGGD
jgi:hypothetical protein